MFLNKAEIIGRLIALEKYRFVNKDIIADVVQEIELMEEEENHNGKRDA